MSAPLKSLHRKFKIQKLKREFRHYHREPTCLKDESLVFKIYNRSEFCKVWVKLRDMKGFSIDEYKNFDFTLKSARYSIALRQRHKHTWSIESQ
jgi:ribosomal protein L13E